MIKNFLGIVVLGLLWCNVGFTNDSQKIIDEHLSGRSLDPIEGVWTLQGSHETVITIIYRIGKDIYVTERIDGRNTGIKKCNLDDITLKKTIEGVYEGSFYPKKSDTSCKLSKYRVDFKYLLSQKFYHATYRGELIKFPISRTWPEDIISHNAKYKTDQDIKDEEKELALIVNDVKKTCGILGFEPGTEKFADCTLKLYTQKIDEKIAAKQEANSRSLQTSSTTTQSSSGTNTTIIFDPVRDKQNMIDQGMKMLGGKCTLGIDC